MRKRPYSVPLLSAKYSNELREVVSSRALNCILKRNVAHISRAEERGLIIFMVQMSFHKLT